MPYFRNLYHVHVQYSDPNCHFNVLAEISTPYVAQRIPVEKEQVQTQVFEYQISTSNPCNDEIFDRLIFSFSNLKALYLTLSLQQKQ